jgi:aquaporin Z
VTSGGEDRRSSCIAGLHQNAIAQCIATFALIHLGFGSAVLAGGEVVELGISFAFGLAIVAMAFGIGPVCGCHVNPAISFGALVSGWAALNNMLPYRAVQLAGALAGVRGGYLIASGRSDCALAADGLGRDGWSPGYLGKHAQGAASVFGVVATFLFAALILWATRKAAPGMMASLEIGLTPAAIHIVGIQMTGVPVNPARSFGPAMIIGGHAILQLWRCLNALFVGGSAGGCQRLLEA